MEFAAVHRPPDISVAEGELFGVATDVKMGGSVRCFKVPTVLKRLADVYHRDTVERVVAKIKHHVTDVRKSCYLRHMLTLLISTCRQLFHALRPCHLCAVLT
jgi:hypothetical protein